ncbi:Uncharacterized protein ChrSV_0086 [Chromobacterium vaccinii]|nr:Uncharacterized protein ChrSW_0086 [Chromobacterium vaccinii]QND87545.1 Uncharacterized protein ChrSV_0086 [Chromobacterium vaccinii]
MDGRRGNLVFFFKFSLRTTCAPHCPLGLADNRHFEQVPPPPSAITMLGKDY